MRGSAATPRRHAVSPPGDIPSFGFCGLSIKTLILSNSPNPLTIHHGAIERWIHEMRCGPQGARECSLLRHKER